MTELIPLSIATPMVIAAALVALASFIGRGLADLIAIGTALAATLMLSILLYRSTPGPYVYWFGGWTPTSGFAIGVPFIVDKIGLGCAVLIGGLGTAALIFSWRYFETVRTLYHALMLIFLAAMIAFSLSGDLFNMFVFFELMSVVAYSLTGYKIEEESALEGAINLAITNSIGAFFVLIAIALLYGRTGSLNLAQIGRVLAQHPADGLVICAVVFMFIGFLVKAAAVPLHFWITDAHAVAPTPVCVLFSGVMVELGIYAVARIYWTAFSGIPGLPGIIRTELLAVGLLTAAIGGAMSILQRHLKRLLAFSTVSHVGIGLVGVAALSPIALAGSAIYVVGHGLVKAALFICAGALLQELGTLDEIEAMPYSIRSYATMVVYMVAALALLGLPPFVTAGGKELIERSFSGPSAVLVSAVIMFSAAVSGAAVLRAGGRIFLGGDP